MLVGGRREIRWISLHLSCCSVPLPRGGLSACGSGRARRVRWTGREREHQSTGGRFRSEAPLSKAHDERSQQQCRTESSAANTKFGTARSSEVQLHCQELLMCEDCDRTLAIRNNVHCIV